MEIEATTKLCLGVYLRGLSAPLKKKYIYIYIYTQVTASSHSDTNLINITYRDIFNHILIDDPYNKRGLISICSFY